MPSSLLSLLRLMLSAVAARSNTPEARFRRGVAARRKLILVEGRSWCDYIRKDPRSASSPLPWYIYPTCPRVPGQGCEDLRRGWVTDLEAAGAACPRRGLRGPDAKGSSGATSRLMWSVHGTCLWAYPWQRLFVCRGGSQTGKRQGGGERMCCLYTFARLHLQPALPQL